VLMTPAEARAESTRLYSANSSRQRHWHTGWSDSPLGKMTDREKTQYVKDWDSNRPTPYTRDLSIDVWGNNEKSESPGSTPRRNLRDLVTEEQAPSPAPAAVEPQVEIMVIQEAPGDEVSVIEEKVAPGASSRMPDPNKPLPAR
jgi:hypothetical protein